MASTRSPTAKPTPSSGTNRLTPSEIASLREEAEQDLEKLRADRMKAEANPRPSPSPDGTTRTLMTAEQHRRRAAQLWAVGHPRAAELAVAHEQVARMIEARQARAAAPTGNSLPGGRQAAGVQRDS